MSRTESMVLALVAGGVLLAWYFFGTMQTGLFKDDAGYYARLSESLADPARLPYTFRLLTPAIVGIIPLDTTTSFTLVTLVSLDITAILLNFFLAGCGATPFSRWAAIGLFLVSGCVVRATTTPMYVDCVTYALTLAAFLALLKGRDLLFAVLVAVGVTNRETALFLLPSYLFLRESWRSSPARVKALLVCGIPLVTLVILVLVKSAAAGFFSPGSELSSALRYGGASARLPQIGDVTDLYSEFGILWLVTMVGLFHASREVRTVLPYAALVVLQVLIARGDESRILSHLLPLVFLCTARELDLIARVASGERARYVLLGALVIGAALSMVHFRWTLIPWASVRYGVIALGTVMGLVVIIWRLTRRPADRRALVEDG